MSRGQFLIRVDSYLETCAQLDRNHGSVRSVKIANQAFAIYFLCKYFDKTLIGLIICFSTSFVSSETFTYWSFETYLKDVSNTMHMGNETSILGSRYFTGGK